MYKYKQGCSVMRIEKLTSEKGQISMEIGILVAAAVAVATAAAYYYIKGIRGSGGKIEVAAKDIIGTMSNGTEDYAEKIDEILGGSGGLEEIGGSVGDEEGGTGGEDTKPAL